MHNVEKDGEFDDDWVFTNIQELSKDKTPEAIDLSQRKVILLVHLYCKYSGQDEKVPVYNRGGAKGAKSSLAYERMMICYDPLAPEGMNIATLLVGRGQNPNLFSKHLSERDTNLFSELCVH